MKNCMINARIEDFGILSSEEFLKYFKKISKSQQFKII
jgi:hypothetical protein